jgi:hypothetical protein
MVLAPSVIACMCVQSLAPVISHTFSLCFYRGHDLYRSILGLRLIFPKIGVLKLVTMHCVTVAVGTGIRKPEFDVIPVISVATSSWDYFCSYTQPAVLFGNCYVQQKPEALLRMLAAALQRKCTCFWTVRVRGSASCGTSSTVPPPLHCSTSCPTLLPCSVPISCLF